jgi:hypothetical protein
MDSYLEFSLSISVDERAYLFRSSPFGFRRRLIKKRKATYFLADKAGKYANKKNTICFSHDGENSIKIKNNVKLSYWLFGINIQNQFETRSFNFA